MAVHSPWSCKQGGCEVCHGQLIAAFRARGLSPTGRAVTITGTLHNGVKPLIEELAKYQWDGSKEDMFAVLYGREVIVGIDPTHNFREVLETELKSVAAYPKHKTLQGYAAADVQATLNMHNATTPEGEQMNRLDVIENQMKALERERAILSRYPKAAPADGTIISFKRVFGGSWEELSDSDIALVWSYAGVVIKGQVYLTHGRGANAHTSPMSWSQFVEWLGDHSDGLRVMTTDYDLLNGETGKQPAEDYVGKYESIPRPEAPTYDKSKVPTWPIKDIPQA